MAEATDRKHLEFEELTGLAQIQPDTKLRQQKITHNRLAIYREQILTLSTSNEYLRGVLLDIQTRSAIFLPFLEKCPFCSKHAVFQDLVQGF